ncbi:MAG: anaerobic ribonucleoside-triphosphate reductase activating protein [Oscillospiraceae bacterium]|nr:anaerobic ribonucleoside-triphosphate reductase activating protein [Oscillospiraceae bacterium]
MSDLQEAPMRIHHTMHDSIVDGPGLRYVVFTQGCPHRCPGCHNPATHDTDGGREMPVEDIIRDMLRNPLTDGLTLTGGEPFLQAEDCAKIARAAHEAGLNVWCYSGYTLEQLREIPEAEVLLKEIDVLVDGPYLEAQRSLSLQWRGSENQRIIELG